MPKALHIKLFYLIILFNLAKVQFLVQFCNKYTA